MICYGARISNQEDHSMRRREFIAGLGAVTTEAVLRFDRAYGQGMSAITHRMIQANGIHLHIAEQGEGPLVVMCHGFPECWYSWRHQLVALSAAGFHAVAPDMRGYGQSDRPEAIDQFTLLHLVDDMVGVLDALGAEQAVIAGHDWGARVAWYAALLRPDRFRAVITLSVPYASSRGLVPPTSVMPRTSDAQFYQLYFQRPGEAEAEFERDVRQTFLKTLASAPSITPAEGIARMMVPRKGGFLSGWQTPSSLPAWLDETDLDFYVNEFKRAGFRGGLNWYRNIDRNWELLAAYAGAKVTVPALYMAGDRDPVVHFQGMDQVIANLANDVPRLRGKIMLPGCGHWIQQERAPEVNIAMIDFLRQL
jgi:pimeloyl-ACP methyl ester carboxylesterase